MSDRTYFQLIVYACPPEQQEAVLDVIDEYGLTPESAEAPEPRALLLDERYVYDETALGTSSEVASNLMRRAPSTAFECWEDPKYEYGGQIHRYTPELGLFEGDCNSEGQSYLTEDRIAAFLDTKAYGALGQQAGLPWRHALDAYKEVAS